MELREEFFQLVRSIPSGRVSNYGALGQALSRPVSGVIAGRRLQNVSEEVPWWRVVGRDGRLPIWKIDPSMESLQMARLMAEGVEFEDGLVPRRYFTEPE